MPTLGITGGIATGKSTFTKSLLQVFPADAFDADRCAHELLASDPNVHRGLVVAFGPEIIGPDGAPDRARLRDLVFRDATKRGVLEDILHPLIRERWITQAKQARRTDRWLLVDIPLLFETAAEEHCDSTIVVACTGNTQQRRLHTLRGMNEELAANIIASQLDLSTKIRKADHLIWNDSTLSCLDQQTRLLAGWLRLRYG